MEGVSYHCNIPDLSKPQNAYVYVKVDQNPNFGPFSFDYHALHAYMFYMKSEYFDLDILGQKNEKHVK